MTPPTPLPPPAGRPDEEPTEPASAAAVAGLAREVEGLRRAMQESAGLPGRVETLAELVARLAEKLARRPAAEAGVLSWLRFDPGAGLDAEQVLRGLAGWVGEVYLRYEDAARAFPACWLWHPAVVEELLWLWVAWAAAYDSPDARISQAADWHDRYRPGVVRRVREQVRSCSIEVHQPGYDRDTRTSGGPVTDPVAVAQIAEWWAYRRHQPPPAPTAALLAAAAERPARRGRS